VRARRCTRLRALQVGGFHIFHADDARRLAPRWLQLMGRVRAFASAEPAAFLNESFAMPAEAATDAELYERRRKQANWHAEMCARRARALRGAARARALCATRAWRGGHKAPRRVAAARGRRAQTRRARPRLPPARTSDPSLTTLARVARFHHVRAYARARARACRRYGYVFAAGEAGMRHRVRKDVMLYPGYAPHLASAPLILHYGSDYKLAPFPGGRADLASPEGQGIDEGEYYFNKMCDAERARGGRGRRRRDVAQPSPRPCASRAMRLNAPCVPSCDVPLRARAPASSVP
jgi:hypothetical protein